MKIQIEAYGPGAFLKSGKLKKRPQQECGFMMVDIEPYTAGAMDSFIEETAGRLKRDYRGFRSPYFFTHIECESIATGETVRIFESVNDLITSPVKLLAALTK